MSFKGIKIKDTILSVIDTRKKVRLREEERNTEKEDIVGLLGREVMDSYIVSFNGTANPKRLHFSK